MTRPATAAATDTATTAARSAYSAEGWTDFAVATTGAAAALAGLLFVALSINLSGILTGRGLTARAAYTLVLLATPLLVGVLLLVPDQDERVLGAELLVVGAGSGLALARLSRPGRRSREQRLVWWAATEATPALVLTASTALAGVGLLTGALGGLYWVPGAVLAAFLAALINAWVLLVEILR
ncbi:hypothetical protein B1813_01735 [Saccharomonospora piscinae]|uniref:Modulator of FtsH protease n=1 Tax=Saccharomonospora piscinae TaxID=687388 RepID=A0A1V9ACQ7_SACPI|nr:hypothetical protein [Saccharomonospora piscinae]OQO94826.1 hypothetical protein B1813_01735 [Saccharomonospora piscinae]